ncbi:F-box-like domain-containing protein [Microdochium nivale]|nr:F-box-like domain-containing protein [Microdochium nivale]
MEDKICYIDKLPLEVLQRIGDACAFSRSVSSATRASSYAKLCRVSRRFASCFTPRLYATIDTHKAPIHGLDNEQLDPDPSRGDALKDLMRTIASTPTLCTHIRCIELYISSNTTPDAKETLFKAKDCVVQAHGQGFHDNLAQQVHNEELTWMYPRDNWACCVAVIIALSPNLHTLQLCSDTWCHPAIRAVLLHPNNTGARIIDRIRLLDLGSRYLPGHVPELAAAATLSTLTLRRMWVDEIRKLVAIVENMPTQLTSCTFFDCQLPALFLRKLLSRNTGLAQLQLLHHGFGSGFLAPNLINRYLPRLTLADAGQALRAHGQSLVTLVISPEPQPHQYGHLGSLRALSSLENLELDPRLLLPHPVDYPLEFAECMPPRLKQLELAAPPDNDYAPLLAQIGALITCPSACPRLRRVAVMAGPDSDVTYRSMCVMEDSRAEDLEAVAVQIARLGWICMARPAGWKYDNLKYDLVFLKGRPQTSREFVAAFS